MSALASLYPQPLWQWFAQICAIPHPSKHEQALSQHIQTWARDKGLSVLEDKVGNLIIKKPATAGLENRKTVVIQAHLDMVPQKNADKQHDFTTDPIDAYVDGDWVKAKGTTLGADNGIGMASALAILGSDDIKHGPLEVLLTVDEEAGMTGAFGVEPGMLDAEILINTDSEQEGEIYMGCAGGVDAEFTLPAQWQAPANGVTAFTLSLTGLKGGHSGVNIHLGRGNANKLLARFLADNATVLDLAIAGFNGGSLRNAIPREASVTLTLPAAKLAQLQQAVAEYQALLQFELAAVEPALKLSLNETTIPAQVLSAKAQSTLINLLNVCQNGVMRMSDEVAGVTETSLNMGVITTTDHSVQVLCLIRSLIDSGREQVESMLSSLAQLAGAEVKFSGAYPGWKPNPDSPVMAIVRDTYQDIYHKEPVIMVIHAGLECGLFKKPYPDMDMVSIGPTIRFPHGPDEMVNITTVGQYWELLLAVLERIPERG
ncbi:MAG: aminoacyl-histidine dipeptidase [Gammaproteobacteria bacterium]|nr:aminoacyl-histidine dipeptidase [Gammaproteobacteria bacterium]MBU1553739.1 aminoacyl-histidine dipeptidase [Gammaproteobacteria bacterium]MBU2070666.1 aminoacyl-histidine dipeptidase [Gammaproteobacteria bacterium]MBU2184240.1 aminoacyl-histidine dipeptidase [Gammaproteobacteria bacterium]MBU2206101.1 aminoacyl-histidine dipeptidase [Gammaproteobacteria bacterium]